MSASLWTLEWSLNPCYNVPQLTYLQLQLCFCLWPAGDVSQLSVDSPLFVLYCQFTCLSVYLSVNVGFPLCCPLPRISALLNSLQ